MLVGEDPASTVYVGGKQRACLEVGMVPFDRRLMRKRPSRRLPRSSTASTRIAAVNGVLLQLPVPDHLDGPALTAMIDPGKDVDGLTPVNVGAAVARAARG